MYAMEIPAEADSYRVNILTLLQVLARQGIKSGELASVKCGNVL